MKKKSGYTGTHSFEWWNDDNEIKESHKIELREKVMERMSEMSKEGYVAGELFAEIDGIEYRGWWKI